MAKQLFKTCHCCKGSGKEEVTGVYADTWRLLRKHGPATGARLLRMVGCEPSAMNNRLAFLEHEGFATSRRNGRERIYKAVDA